MSETYDPEQTLEEYGYGRSSKGKTPIIILLVILLLLAVGTAIFMGKLWSDEQSKMLALEQQVEVMSSRTSELENKNAELSSLLADKQAETERIREEWATQVDRLKQQHNETLQRTYAQMNDIVYDSRKTLTYINDIENRLRAGQKLNEEETAQLSSVVNGLIVLHEQYKRPLNEFRELNRYLNQQLASLPEDAVDPIETTSLGQRLFRNREFKEERMKFYESQGRRTALVEATDAVQEAYSSAQRQMAGVSLNMNQYLSDLEAIMASNERTAEEVSAFFDKSKEILNIHDKIMTFEPPQPEEVSP
ncbi:MAG: hypothetical protein AAGA96_05720 [Verrucomicrobiota bacterium]